MLTKIATLTLKESDKLDLLIENLQILQTHTRNEPGCNSFTFYQQVQQPDSFYLVEQFHDQAALDNHLELPHTRAFFALGLINVSHITPLTELQ